MEEMYLRNYAYLGDAVWELYVRENTVHMTDNAEHLHKITTEKVNAAYQARLLQLIRGNLTEEEVELLRRGRNLPIPAGRRQIQNEYRSATAFEVLIGRWYTNDKERMKYMFELMNIFKD